MKKKYTLIGILLLLLAGCSNITGHTYFNENISKIEEHLDYEDWGYLQKQAKDLKVLYDDQQWKLQLLGDEGEYEGLNISIHRLIKAIEHEDTTRATLELATIKVIINDIYSL
ncbi:DUF4363 family protein [Sporosarcina pasteurii]|uniref:DUF4363 family protein n=1 Tax=Sporosarcina pasteurii TaxID=1474 RepID=A0A380BQK4_SPOPA|nr:DUF4363 family protein [Sporosarcina pasteurii]MDS9471173.1 DUF4363 family protein [Sporosarcina pasteurii]QBQ05188.1 DUF4363 family protein [Sporosarcina pasteurii]SUJ05412.1 Uncharacterised protein [Sporosarcina pasteurii]